MPAKKAAKKVAKTAVRKTAKKAAKTADPDQPKPARKTAKKTTTSPKPGPSTDQIAAAAYLNYRRRVDEGLPGNHEGDWLKAEQELAERKK